MRTLHLGLRVTDLDRSLAFYAALGYKIVGEVPEAGLGAPAVAHETGRADHVEHIALPEGRQLPGPQRHAPPPSPESADHLPTSGGPCARGCRASP